MVPNAKSLTNAIGYWVEETQALSLSPQRVQGGLEAIGAVDRAMKSLRARECFLGGVWSDGEQDLGALGCSEASPAFAI